MISTLSPPVKYRHFVRKPRLATKFLTPPQGQGYSELLHPIAIDSHRALGAE